MSESMLMVFQIQDGQERIQIGFPRESVLSFRQKFPSFSEKNDGKKETTLVMLKGEHMHIEVEMPFAAFLSVMQHEERFVKNKILQKMACQDV